MEDKVYCCIDLKSFFASVECVDRSLDPFRANLIVADVERSSGTVCLAVSPAMKNLGVKNRCRVFEIPKNIEYIIAKPRMKLYMEKSAEIYSIYLKYISPDDIHVYSIDECFIDLTDYEKLYNKTPKELAKMLIDEVYKKTGIRATVGLGTNLFLTKVALDVSAKHADDFMAFLDQETFKKTLWHHRPITDIWNIGSGIAKRLERFGIFDLKGITTANEDMLYREFGVNAELLIDHANGIEPCTIEDIHAYKSKSNSISNGQILFADYSFDDAYTVLKEMVDGITLELVEKGLMTNNISLIISYADKSLKATGGSKNILGYTDSFKKIMAEFTEFYRKTTRKDQPIRRIGVGLNNVVQEMYTSYDLFSDFKQIEKEKELQKTVLKIKGRFGKNSILKGVSFEEKATARERNKMIGGHKSGENE